MTMCRECLLLLLYGGAPNRRRTRTTDVIAALFVRSTRNLPVLSLGTVPVARRRGCLPPPPRRAMLVSIKEECNVQVAELRKLWSNKKQLSFQVLNLAMIVFSALMMWKGECGALCVVVVVVVVCVLSDRRIGSLWMGVSETRTNPGGRA